MSNNARARLVEEIKAWRGWVTLYADVSWEDYGGVWAYKTKDGAWYVVQFDNLVDSGGREFEDMPFEVRVKRLDFKDLSEKNLLGALAYTGCPAEYSEENSSSLEEYELRRLDACISYGLGAPLYEETASVHPVQLRARGRKYVESLMRDSDLLESRMSRTVNRLGSTAREFGVGDLDSALNRRAATPDTESIVMRKISHATIIRQCKFAILLASHWRADGTCKCDDSEHREMMCKPKSKGGWGYKPEMF